MTEFPNFSHGRVFEVASLRSVAGSCYGENKNLFFPFACCAEKRQLLPPFFCRSYSGGLLCNSRNVLHQQPGSAPAAPPLDDHRSAVLGLAASCLSVSGLYREETALVRKCRRPSSEPTVRQPETASPLSVEV